MKKVLAVISVVCVMCAASSAIASPSKNDRHRPMQPQVPGIEQRQDFRGPEGRFDGRPRPPFEARRAKGSRFTPDMPQEIREKVAELAKLRVDLEEAMTSKPLNKAKALEVHAKILAVKNEVEAWRFAKKLERIEAMRKQRELNKNEVPPEKPELEQAE